MRRMVVGLGLLWAAGPAAATNPADGAPPGSSDFLRLQATDYASRVMTVVRFIDQRYVRPVPTATLVEACLAGLYEAAREPMPASLKADLARAKEPREFGHLLATARERLGDLEALRDQRALHASLRTLPRALDPYSGLAHLSDRRIYSQANVTGVGLEFEAGLEPADHALEQSQTPRIYAGPGRHRGPARVAAVTPGGPAQRAGVRPGDVLLLINGKPLTSPEGAQFYPLLFAQSGDTNDRLKLTFQRPGRTEPLHCDVLPTTFVAESVFGVRRRLDNDWDFMLDRDRRIGYVRLGFIDESSDDEMEAAISGLKAAGMKALVFDLRGCPGGFVDPARSISGMFVKSGLIATITERVEGEPTFKYVDKPYKIANGSGLLQDIPTIVLIDGETRGGGEMVAAVLQDHKVARTAGQRSVGKGSIQKTEPLREIGDLQLKLTTGTFTRPNGKNLNRFPASRLEDDWGIRPDPGLEFPISPELERRIKEWMQQQVLRPGDSREPLPLDDPDNDPLREFARRELLKVLK